MAALAGECRLAAIGFVVQAERFAIVFTDWGNRGVGISPAIRTT
jgi:hypothetical protein